MKNNDNKQKEAEIGGYLTKEPISRFFTTVGRLVRFKTINAHLKKIPNCCIEPWGFFVPMRSAISSSSSSAANVQLFLPVWSQSKKMTDSKHGSKSNLNESNMPLLSEEAAEKAGDTPEKEVMIEMTETEKVYLILTFPNLGKSKVDSVWISFEFVIILLVF